ncbi:MAG: hypothetical protein ABL929_02015 [Ferruginibacter sp.]|nr:hypothetical protein [Ferruginibacter sp.]
MRFTICLGLSIFFFSCNNKKIPNVSHIKIDIKTQRFEDSFFAIDSNKMAIQLDKLVEDYPSFGKLFLIDILGVDPRWSIDTTANYLNAYKAYSKTLYDSSKKYFSDFSIYEKQIKKGLQYVHYYYPKYKLPTKIITFIGPANGSGDGIGTDFLSIGLQAHLGKDFPLYKNDDVRNTYPDYVSARFTPDYIAINCMKNIVDDIYPPNNDDKRLLVQIIDRGKRLFLLNSFLPDEEPYKLIGYTKQQMQDCIKNEPGIWNLFIQNNFLQTADNSLIRNYVSEGPKTQELGEGAPGNIGSFAGWQIVNKFAAKYPEIMPDSLMEIDNEIIYQKAKYKP